MEQRIRPVTYAESLAAKQTEQKMELDLTEKTETPEKPKEKDYNLPKNNWDLGNLPSMGKPYPPESSISFTSLTFGEMKFLSGSTLTDIDTIDFFLSKIEASFPVGDLTYFDFYFLVTMIKLSTFGELEFYMNFECVECGSVNKAPFTANDLEFVDLDVELPVIIDLEKPYKSSHSDLELSKVSFTPISIGRFRKMVQEDKRSDLDLQISNCIKEGTEEERLEIIKRYLNGVNINLLETIDVEFFHGVKDLQFACKHVLSTNEDGTKEVCGRLHDIPFQDIIEYASATDRTKESLRKRIHFGVQN